MELLKDYHAMFCFGLLPPMPEKGFFLGANLFSNRSRAHQQKYSTLIDSSAFTMFKLFYLL